MKNENEIFLQIPCLTDQSVKLDGRDLQKKWFKKADRRIISQYLQKFISYNQEQFLFLGITPHIHGSDQNVALSFTTTNYVGCIPLRAPDTGKQIGDLIVTPRYLKSDKTQEYIEVLEHLQDEISIETIDSLPLKSGLNFRPPLYFEAIKFIQLVERLIKTSWQKFTVSDSKEITPSGQVNWNRYANDSYKVEKLTIFPTTKNTLSIQHKEYNQLKYVYDICRNEILSGSTPLSIKLSFKKTLEILDSKLRLHSALKTDVIVIRKADNLLIRQLKEQANRILQFKIVTSTAWRIDFSIVFERFVQNIFKQVSKEIGSNFHANYKFRRRGKGYSWELNHIEPDCILQKGENTIVVDAKYKSHLYNSFSNSVSLKNDYRSDLHQIISYSAFNISKSRFAFLCYPSNSLHISYTSYHSPLSNVEIKIFLTGLPLSKLTFAEAKNMIINSLDSNSMP